VRKSQDSIIIEANFKELKQETRRQTLVLKALTEQFKIMEQKPRTLIFHHCSVLTSDLLEPFLHPHLEKLDLSLL